MQNAAASRTKKLFLWVPFLILAAVALFAYHNSFSGPFIFDDQDFLVDRSEIGPLLKSWWFSPYFFSYHERILVQTSFAINRLLGGSDTTGYHAFNLFIHVLSACLLYMIALRTFRSKNLKQRYAQAAEGLALSAAVLWVCHPLLTQSVTYLAQRAESMMSLFYLFALYSFARSVDSQRPRAWLAASFISCWLGMKCKEVIATAPLVILFYDRTFISGSFRAAWKQRKIFFLSLCLIWLPLIIRMADSLAATMPSGFQFKGISRWGYARTQPEVILHYLKLAFWPHPLCLDYAWFVAKTPGRILIPGMIVGALFVLSTIIFLWRPKLRGFGFLGLGFFLILAPTSSIMPIADIAAEHRMYLPLAFFITFIVIAGYEALAILFDKYSLPKLWRFRILIGLVTVCTLALSIGTISRNADYQSEISIWSDVVKKRPDNPRGYYSLGNALNKMNEDQEAIEYYMKAISLMPNYADAHANLGHLLYDQGKVELAKFHLSAALQADPDNATANNNWGALLMSEGKTDEGIRYFTRAVQNEPRFRVAQKNLKNALEEYEKSHPTASRL